MADKSHIDETIERQFAEFQAVLGALREIRSRQNIAPKTEIAFRVKCDEQTAGELEAMSRYFRSMAAATADGLGADAAPPKPSAAVTLTGLEVYVDLAGHIDVAAERERLMKQYEKTEKLAASKEKKLANANFVDRAPADVVDRERASLVELQEQLASIKTALSELKD